MSKEKRTVHSHAWTAKSQRIMLSVIIVGILLCTLLFSILGVHMGQNSRETVDEIGNVNMRDTGMQMTKRFETVMEQRLQMVRSLSDQFQKNIDPSYEKYMSVEEAKKVLVEDSRLRGFEYIAFYYVDRQQIDDKEIGSTKDIMSGYRMEVTDKIPFRTSALNKEEKIAVGQGWKTEADYNKFQNGDTSGTEDIVLLSIPCDLVEMSNGQRSMSLIAGITNQSFVDMLGEVNNETNNETGAYIIRRKDENDATGESNSFVMQSKNKNYTYFSELVKTELSESDISTDELLQQLNRNIDAKEPFSSVIHIGEQHIHMYCNTLPKSEWYLVTITDSVELNVLINSLTKQWIIMVAVVIITIAVVLTVIFVLYHYYNVQNMRTIEQARQEALHASKAKSEFLSNMSHDIRTPMNAIVGMTAIARANIDDPQQVNACLKKIAISSKHLLGLINDVLDMSKIESGKMTLNVEQVSLREVLDGIATVVQPQIKIKRQNFSMVIRRVEQENVYCDSVRLNQVLLNLLSNAIKFTSEEGTIEIRLDQEESPVGEDFVRTHIFVKDNGIGMSPEYQQKIFESFSREDSKRVHHTEGSGLGMAITKYIVDAMKGTITFQSELGKGTEFHITLDLEKALIPEQDMILPSLKMLLVDDDQQLCETTVMSLKELGIDSEWTLDGESAVEKAVKAHDARHPYDVVLLDWRLPGIDGIETAKRIRKRLGEEVPILLISAYDWAEIESEAREAGICGFISKPLFKSTLFYGLKSFVCKDNPAEAEKPTEKPVTEKIHVLLAEDNELNWEIAETLLDGVGITCDHAENGQICVDMLKNSKPGTYKAILMDIRMPVMTGYEATEAIRKLDHPDKDLPIIAMTADAFADDMKKCLECGMNAHISKPIDIDLVKKTLEKFIK